MRAAKKNLVELPQWFRIWTLRHGLIDVEVCGPAKVRREDLLSCLRLVASLITVQDLPEGTRVESAMLPLEPEPYTADGAIPFSPQHLERLCARWYPDRFAVQQP